MNKSQLSKKEQHDKVKEFLSKWKLNNTFNPTELKKHNEAFKKDFNAWLLTEKLDSDMLSLYFLK